MKKVAILQSNYIPWKGYFDVIASVDEFIIYDEVQYTRSDWRNRNQIKTPQGVQWLTVPVMIKGRLGQTIRETEIKMDGWAEKHWRTLCMNYSRAPHFSIVAECFEPLYRQEHYAYLSELNRSFIDKICGFLGISTKISNSWDYTLIEGKTERLVNLCLQAGASEYISGPAAKDYIIPELFEAENIKLTWFDYSGYPEYPQLWGGFEHGVSIMDVMFNCGKNATQFMKFAGIR